MYITMIFLYFSSKWGADQLGGKSLAYCYGKWGHMNYKFCMSYTTVIS